MNRRRLALAVGAALSTVLLLTSCAQSGGETPAAAGGQRPPGPVFYTPDELEGETVVISLEIPLVITIEDDDILSKWNGDVEDAAVAEFTAGEIRDGASFSPGFAGLAEGTTKATLVGPEGKTIAFTLTVVENNEDVTTH